ncbi:hypothetical protein MKW98_005526 [Papaver atlanticum]|uniref:Uncharacterized protein n=1 Tax=Papaver atlanticum TaxID=357466 RepID=A0AAD4T7V8_9MAGN|nr:hypothetical protein MKW98_005526 [Papaver atlanticum]
MPPVQVPNTLIIYLNTILGKSKVIILTRREKKKEHAGGVMGVYRILIELFFPKLGFVFGVMLQVAQRHSKVEFLLGERIIVNG